MNSNFQQHYKKPTKATWTGRPDPLRVHQTLATLDLLTHEAPGKGYALLGFACDEGIRRNHGRPGAALGPNAIRQHMVNLPTSPEHHLWDAGDVVCEDKDLEAAQAALAEGVQRLLSLGLMPVVLGGGHEVAFGHYQGIMAAHPNLKLGIVNLDAHLDMRSLEHHQGTSGTSFLQIQEACDRHQRDFHYLCMGAQALGNSESVLKNAHRAQVVSADTIRTDPGEALRVLERFMFCVDALYLTVCMDVFAECAAPGVSAPQPFGLLPHHLLPVLDALAQSGKLISLDVAELSPPLDTGGMTARLAAHLLGRVLLA